MATALEQSGQREEAVEVYERLIEVRERSPLYGPSREAGLLDEAEERWAKCAAAFEKVSREG